MSDERHPAQLPEPLDLADWRRLPNILLFAGGAVVLLGNAIRFTPCRAAWSTKRSVGSRKYSRDAWA